MNLLTAPRAFPTRLDSKELEDVVMNGAAGIHESLLRSYQVLNLVKSLLEKKVDHDVILQVIELNYEEQQS